MEIIISMVVKNVFYNQTLIATSIEIIPPFEIIISIRVKESNLNSNICHDHYEKM